jgi:glycogen phosphorylase
LLPRFSSTRMLYEYIDQFYGPASRQGKLYNGQEFRVARDLAGWKAKVRASWGGIALRRVDAAQDKITHGTDLRIAIAAKLNGLDSKDVCIEMLSARAPHSPLKGRLQGATLTYDRFLPDSQEHLYALDWKPEVSGKVEYRFRAYPHHEHLTHRFEMGMMTWL